MRKKSLYPTIAALSLSAAAVFAQTVEKVVDLNFSTFNGIGFGGYAPLDRFTQDGTNLWFTTKSGGTFDAGTISRFDLVTHEVVEVASFDNNTGKASESWITIIDGQGYFTTVSGGVGNKGTIAKIDLSSGVITTLFAFPADGSAGSSPRDGLTRIKDDLWATTSLGGTSSRGTLIKYSIASNTVSVITNFDGPQIGGQPFDGLVQSGNAWFFTTFSGGSNFNTTNFINIVQSDGSTVIFTNKLPLGAGTLGSLTFDTNDQPIVTTLANVPAGYEQFPALEPLPVGTNSLYFTTTGPNQLPGAILRYDRDTGLLTNLYSFPTNDLSATNIGTRPGYSGLVEWQGDLYFINRSGGTNNLGTVAKFSIASNTVAKLADLDGPNLGSASGFFGTGTIVEDNSRFYIYYPLTAGGANSRGAIIRIALPPPPISTVITAAAEQNTVQLSWSGGYPPFTVQTSDNLANPVWTITSENITNRTLSIQAQGTAGFYRVTGNQ